jgi:hypothetical protein
MDNDLIAGDVNPTSVRCFEYALIGVGLTMVAVIVGIFFRVFL